MAAAKEDDASRIDADRLLALSYLSARRRAPLQALWRLDATLAGLVARGANPLVTQMKLAWWRDALGRLNATPAPAEPLLTTLAADAIPRGLRGEALAALPAAWEYLLGPDPLSPADLDGYAQERGGTLFDLSTTLLGGASDAAIQAAGEAWALVDFARHSRKSAETNIALAAAADRLDRAPKGWPKGLEILSMLTIISRRDVARGHARFESPGAPARMLRMLGHRLTGR